MDTYEVIEVSKQMSKANKEYDVLLVRHVVQNADNVIVELMEGKAFPVKGVEYKKGQLLRPELAVTRSRNGFFEVTELRFIPIDKNAQPK